MCDDDAQKFKTACSTSCYLLPQVSGSVTWAIENCRYQWRVHRRYGLRLSALADLSQADSEPERDATPTARRKPARKQSDTHTHTHIHTHTQDTKRWTLKALLLTDYCTVERVRILTARSGGIRRGRLTLNRRCTHSAVTRSAARSSFSVTGAPIIISHPPTPPPTLAPRIRALLPRHSSHSSRSKPELVVRPWDSDFGTQGGASDVVLWCLVPSLRRLGLDRHVGAMPQRMQCPLPSPGQHALLPWTPSGRRRA